MGLKRYFVASKSDSDIGIRIMSENRAVRRLVSLLGTSKEKSKGKMYYLGLRPVSTVGV